MPRPDYLGTEYLVSVKNLGTGKLPWECLYPVMAGGQRKYKRKKFRTKREAEDFDREAYAKLDSSSNVDQSKAEKMTVDQLHQEWLQYLRGTGGRKNTGTAGNTLNRYDEIYRSVIEPRWGGDCCGNCRNRSVPCTETNAGGWSKESSVRPAIKLRAYVSSVA